MKDIKGKTLEVGDVVVCHSVDLYGRIGIVEQLFDFDPTSCSAKIDEWEGLWMRDFELERLGWL